MQILRCDLTLLENTFFSSREVGNFYQTEPVIGNYALCYALGLAVAPYEHSNTIRYAEDLAALNQKGIYVTPAQIVGQARFKIEQFNAMTDSYWYAMGNNALITKPDGWDAVKDKTKWRLINRSNPNETRLVSTGNYPQIGRIKMLGIGNHARFYLLCSSEVPRIPSYIRLGKWNSKARLATQAVAFQTVQRERTLGMPLLNPVDLTDPTILQTFDMIGIHPVPLIRNAVASGSFYQLADPEQTLLPVNMRFGVEEAHRGR